VALALRTRASLPSRSRRPSGRVRLDDEIRDIALWDVIRVAPGVVRAFEAGPDGLELIAVGGPKPEGGDGVRSEAPWPDDADA
jgi:hypothetical protein